MTPVAESMKAQRFNTSSVSFDGMLDIRWPPRFHKLDSDTLSPGRNTVSMSLRHSMLVHHRCRSYACTAWRLRWTSRDPQRRCRPRTARPTSTGRNVRRWLPAMSTGPARHYGPTTRSCHSRKPSTGTPNEIVRSGEPSSPTRQNGRGPDTRLEVHHGIRGAGDDVERVAGQDGGGEPHVEFGQVCRVRADMTCDDTRRYPDGAQSVQDRTVEAVGPGDAGSMW